MKKLFGALLFMVIAVMFIPVVADSVDNYDVISASESFTAVSDDATSEDFTVTETPLTVNSVTVNDVAIVLTTDYTVAGKVFTLLTDSSNVDDIVVVNYDYQVDMGSGIDGLINVILIMFVVGILAGGVAYIKFKN